MFHALCGSGLVSRKGRKAAPAILAPPLNCALLLFPLRTKPFQATSEQLSKHAQPGSRTGIATRKITPYLCEQLSCSNLKASAIPVGAGKPAKGCKAAPIKPANVN